MEKRGSNIESKALYHLKVKEMKIQKRIASKIERKKRM